jgi:superfamily II DNA/RNA helicase
VHRIGRTARAAAEGTAITFISVKEQRKFAAIEKLLGKSVPKEVVPEQFGEAPAYTPTTFMPREVGSKHGKKPMHFSRNSPAKRPS